MAGVLVLFAHPALEKSRVHAQLIRQASAIKGITFHDLYEAYPDFDIDVDKEQALLLEHDVIVWQHPFYWYSAPAIIKQWQDLVLEHGWAYGSGGRQLAGKAIFNAITCGGPREAYSPEGRNRFTIPQFLAAFNQTATLCNMLYLPPFVVHGTHRLLQPAIETVAGQYRRLLLAFAEDRIGSSQWQQVTYLNDLDLVLENA